MALSAPINLTAAGDSAPVIAGPTGRYSLIKVTGYYFVTDAETVLTFKDTLGNALSGPIPLTPAGNGVSRSAPDNDFLYALPKGTGLVINLSAEANVGGDVQYMIVMP